MQNLQAPPSAGRSLLAVLGVVLVGIVIGRLVLERTGTGIAVLAVAIPIVFLVFAAFMGIGRAAVLLGLFLAVVFLVRILVINAGWIVLLMAPAVALTTYMLANVVKTMAQTGDTKERGDGEEKE